MRGIAKGCVSEISYVNETSYVCDNVVIFFYQNAVCFCYSYNIKRFQKIICIVVFVIIFGCDGNQGVEAFVCWGIAKGSSISWVAKFKGDKTSECKLSNSRSRSYREIKLRLSAGKRVVVKLQGDKSA